MNVKLWSSYLFVTLRIFKCRIVISHIVHNVLFFLRETLVKSIEIVISGIPIKNFTLLLGHCYYNKLTSSIQAYHQHVASPFLPSFSGGSSLNYRLDKKVSELCEKDYVVVKILKCYLSPPALISPLNPQDYENDELIDLWLYYVTWQMGFCKW